MNDPERIDFSALDPSKDEARWQERVAETARLAREHHRQSRTVSEELVAWRRPLLAVAAAASLLVWSGAWWRQDRVARETQAAIRAEQASWLLRWAAADEVPPPEVLLRVAGVDDAER